jgi:hypothetical protein
VSDVLCNLRKMQKGPCAASAPKYITDPGWTGIIFVLSGALPQEYQEIKYLRGRSDEQVRIVTIESLIT